MIDPTEGTFFMIDPTEDRLFEGADALLNVLTEYEEDEMQSIMVLALVSFVRGRASFEEANGGKPQTIDDDIRGVMAIAEHAVVTLKQTDDLPVFIQ